MLFNTIRNIQFSLFFLALLLLLSFVTSGIATNDIWGSHGNFDTDDIDRDYDEDGTQDIGGLHIIRGTGMIIGTNDDDFIIGGFEDDTVIAKEGDDEV